MRSAHIEQLFPKLSEAGYKLTSPPNPDYNCIAWAAGDDDCWWEPIQGFQGFGSMVPYFWPSHVSSEVIIEAYVAAFETRGYEVCDSGELEKGYERVALFVDSAGAPSHAARQVENGSWTSKLGKLEDIQHNAVDGVSGDFYGRVALYMRRAL